MGHISIYRGVNDKDYTRVGSWVSSFDPDCGDTLAIELYGHDTGEKPRLSGFIHYNPGVYVSAREPEERVKDVLGVSERLHTISPFTYAVGHALLNGVDVHYADMTKEQSAAYEEAIEDVVANAPSILQGAFRNTLEESLKIPIRNWYMLAKLGEIAADIPQEARDTAASQGKQPKLGFLVGKGHELHLSRTLRAADVPHTTTHNVYRAALASELGVRLNALAFVLVGYDREKRHVRQIKRRLTDMQSD